MECSSLRERFARQRDRSVCVVRGVGFLKGFGCAREAACSGAYCGGTRCVVQCDKMMRRLEFVCPKCGNVGRLQNIIFCRRPTLPHFGHSTTQPSQSLRSVKCFNAPRPYPPEHAASRAHPKPFLWQRRAPRKRFETQSCVSRKRLDGSPQTLRRAARRLHQSGSCKRGVESGSAKTGYLHPLHGLCVEPRSSSLPWRVRLVWRCAVRADLVPEGLGGVELGRRFQGQ